MKTLSPKEKEELKQVLLPLVDDLHRVALSFCHDENAAEELVAATVAKACESYRLLKDKTRIKPWLLRILSNLFISQYRVKARHRHVEYDEMEDNEENQFSLFEQVSQPFLLWWGNPEREVMNKLLDEDIQKAIESLPPEFRITVILCDVESMSYQEIATILNVPIGTVRSRLARGRSLLQKKLWHHAQDLGIIQRKTHDHETIQTQYSTN